MKPGAITIDAVQFTSFSYYFMRIRNVAE